MKRVYGIGLTFLILMLSLPINCSPTDVSIKPHSAIDFNSIQKHSISADLPAITWTSRTHQQPQPVENDSIIAGDHIILNASFPKSYGISNCSMKIWNGFTFSTTRPLVHAQDPAGAFTGIINRTEFDWVVVKGIKKGLRVNISCNFTNTDCDFMVWDGSVDPDSYMFANNIAELVSGATPETDSFIWISNNDTLVLGCLNYDGAPEGNWTLNLRVGVDDFLESAGSSVSYDTYFIEGFNSTYHIQAVGNSDTHGSFVLELVNVNICNFFIPDLSDVFVFHFSDERSFNISWSCTDANSDEINLFSFYLSNDGGNSFFLIANNISISWYVWNSSGWLLGDYVAKIRAYSINIGPGSPTNLADGPSGYWPGDHSEALVNIGQAGSPSVYDPIADVSLTSISNVTYTEGDTGNYLEWELSLSNSIFFPRAIIYTIYRNDTLVFQSQYRLHSQSNNISLNIDNLTRGVYRFEIVFVNPGSSGGIVNDTVYVTVLVPLITTTNTSASTTSNGTLPQWTAMLRYLILGIAGVSFTVILIVVFLFARWKHTSDSTFLF